MDCVYCNKRMEGRRRPTWDHVIPRSCGGSDARENLVRACQLCNGDKANWLLAEWLVLLRCRNDERAPIVEAFAEQFAPFAELMAERQRQAVIEAARVRKAPKLGVLHPNTIADMEAAKQRREERAERNRRQLAEARANKIRRAQELAARNATRLSAGLQPHIKSKDARIVPDYLISTYLEKGFVIDEAGKACDGAKLMHRIA